MVKAGNGLIVILLLLHIACAAAAELLDRVVAYVDNRAITYSEFREVVEKSRREGKHVHEGEVLDAMVNRFLLLKDARRLRLEAPTDDELIKQYIDLRVKSMIIINERDVRAFYEENLLQFEGRNFSEVRDDIERYLFEQETTALLKKQIAQLREQSVIVIQLRDDS